MFRIPELSREERKDLNVSSSKFGLTASSFSRHSRKLSDMAPVMVSDTHVSSPLWVSSGWSRGTRGARRKSGVAAKYRGFG